MLRYKSLVIEWLGPPMLRQPRSSRFLARQLLYPAGGCFSIIFLRHPIMITEETPSALDELKPTKSVASFCVPLAMVFLRDMVRQVPSWRLRVLLSMFA